MIFFRPVVIILESIITSAYRPDITSAVDTASSNKLRNKYNEADELLCCVCCLFGCFTQM